LVFSLGIWLSYGRNAKPPPRERLVG